MTAAPAPAEPVETLAQSPLRLASRRSALALTQSRWVAEQVAEQTGRPLELVEVVTRGDTDRSSLTVIGGQGVFVAAVREALLDGAADLAVHSLKDLPSQPAEGLALSAVPPREDPRDALVARDGLTLATLPRGARVGTGSPRRRAQLLDARPDLTIVDLRGNVDTRLARVLGGGGEGPDLDAVVLAVAGLTRLGRTDVITEILDPAIMTPAPGQGALAVETRTESDPDLATAMAALEHPPTRAAVAAERAFLATLGTGCTLPVGALGHLEPQAGQPVLHLHAVLATEDGVLVRATRSASPDRAEALGAELATELITEAAALARPTQGDPPPTHRESQ